MNKYQEALDLLHYKGHSMIYGYNSAIDKCKNVLQELVDKETPTEVRNETGFFDIDIDYVFDCPKCGKYNVIWMNGEIKYCPNCGQRIEVQDE